MKELYQDRATLNHPLIKLVNAFISQEMDNYQIFQNKIPLKINHKSKSKYQYRLLECYLQNTEHSRMFFIHQKLTPILDRLC